MSKNKRQALTLRKIRVYLMEGRLALAEELGFKLLDKSRNDAELYALLAEVKAKRGDPDHAVGLLFNAIRINPNNFQYYYLLGHLFLQKQDASRAYAAFQQAVERKPELIDAHNQMGILCLNAGRYTEAISHFQKVARVDPAFEEIHYNLGLAYQNAGQLKEAAESYRKAIQINTGCADSHYNLGIVFRALGRQDEAIASYRRAIAIAPGNPKLYNNLGNALLESGRISAAVEAFRDAIRVDPTFALAYASLSVAQKITPESVEARKMEDLLQDPSTTDDQKVYLCFALASVYESQNEYDISFSYLLRGNRIKRASLSYRVADDQKYFADNKKVLTADFIRQNLGAGFHDRAPIFIVGMPRSGTTLVEQVLASHPQVHAGGELNVLGQVLHTPRSDLGYDSFPGDIRRASPSLMTILGKEYVSICRGLLGDFSRFTDKLPMNFMYIGLIRLILPDAIVIHCKRDPVATCFSCFKTYFTGHIPFAYDLREIGQFYTLYEEIMTYWHAVLPGYIYEVQYEKLISDQRRQTERLLEHCGLEWDDQCLEFHKTKRPVRTASVMQVRQKLYASSVQQWRHYERHLRPLLETLGLRPGGD